MTAPLHDNGSSAPRDHGRLQAPVELPSETPAVDWNIATRLTMFEMLLAVMYGDSMASSADGAATLESLKRQIEVSMLGDVRLPPATDDEGRAEWKLHSTVVVHNFFRMAERRRTVAAECIRTGDLQPHPGGAPTQSEEA